MRANRRICVFVAICVMFDAAVYSDYELDSTTLTAQIIADNSTEKAQFKRGGIRADEEIRSERNCCIRNHCFTLLMCTILISMPLLVTIALATTLVVYLLKVRKGRSIAVQKRSINDVKKVKRLKPINTDTAYCSSGSNSSPRGSKASGSSDGQLRPLRNLCDESELSRSIMPSSSSDQEPDERTLNDESPFPK